MEQLIGINTDLGIIKGRDGIFLDQIIFHLETHVTLTGEFCIGDEDIKFEMNFRGVIFFSAIELDFDQRNQMESLALIENSNKIREFKRLDHSSKISKEHKHFYVRTYDSVFEIVSDKFELSLEH